MQDKVAIIGAGRLGQALAKSLLDSGVCLIGIYDLDEAITKPFARDLSISFFTNPHELIDQASIIFLTVPDGKISEVAKQLAAKASSAKTFFHCSGASGLELMAPLAIEQCGCFHPLQSFTGIHSSFKGVYIAIDGNERVCAIAKRLANRLGAETMFVPSADKPLYHAAACIISNYLVTLTAVAEDIFSQWNIPKQAFMPLMLGSMQNIMNASSSSQALTGPIVRGDYETIARHLNTLPLEYQELYTMLGQETCRVACENKNSSDGLQKIIQLLQQRKGE